MKTEPRTTHTPGPWFTEDVTFYSSRAKDNKWVEIWTRGPDGGKQNIIALSGYGAEGFDLKTQKANARLIAAAPELLEAAKEALAWFKAGETGAMDLPFKGKLKAAIAKAEASHV